MSRPAIPRSAIALAVAFLVGVAPAALASKPAHPRLTSLPTSIQRVIAGLRPIARPDPEAPLHLVVVLRSDADAAERTLFGQMYGQMPGQMYGEPQGAQPHFLSPTEFRGRFSPAASRLRAVHHFLTKAGLQVDAVRGANDVWSLSGTVAQAERTFDVHLAQFQRDGRRFLANVVPPRVPTSLGIASVIGLDTWFRFRPATPAAAAPPRQAGCVDGAGCLGLLTVRDLWALYDMPAAHTGARQSIAILGAGDAAGPVADLRMFEQFNRLPAVPVRVVHTDGPRANYGDTSGRREWSMDMQAAAGVAPSVRQLSLYFGSSLLNASLLDDIATWAADKLGPRQASMSITECEDTPISAQTGDFTATPEFVIAADRLLRQATLEGRTLFAASGDLGSSCPFIPQPPLNLNGVGNEGMPVVGYPASSPYVVGVGGTVISTSSSASPQRIAEVGWTGSGGGQSVTYPQPGYQQHVATPIVGSRPCLQQPDGSAPAPTIPCRMVPDVAALSGDSVSNGLAIVASGAPNQTGNGTSLSAPLWAGIWARVQSAQPHRRVLGFANPILYSLAAPTPAVAPGTAAFFDVGAGPGSPPTSNGAYFSTPGYDYVTGLGAPDVARLIGRTAASRIAMQP
jgi:pseudomonalisin